MLSAYQLDRARRNLTGYAVLSSPTPIGVRILSVRPLAGADGDCGCGCGGSGLGALTPAQAVQQAVAAASNVNPKDASGWLSPNAPGWTGVLQSGQISASAYSANCAGMPAPNLNIFQTASGLALGTTSAAVGILGPSGAALIPAAAVPVIGWVIAGVGALIGVIGTIFAHHAAAVKQEQQLGCAAIAAWNNAISLIDQGVQSGQIAPDVASAGLDEVYSKLSSYLAPAVSHSPYCSAACELLIEANAIVLYRKSVYADMAATSAPATASTPAQPGSGSAGSGPATAATVSSGSTLTIPPAAAPAASSPNWLAIAALVFGGFVLARAF